MKYRFFIGLTLKMTVINILPLESLMLFLTLVQLNYYWYFSPCSLGYRQNNSPIDLRRFKGFCLNRACLGRRGNRSSHHLALMPTDETIPSCRTLIRLSERPLYQVKPFSNDSKLKKLHRSLESESTFVLTPSSRDRFKNSNFWKAKSGENYNQPRLALSYLSLSPNCNTKYCRGGPLGVLGLDCFNFRHFLA